MGLGWFHDSIAGRRVIWHNGGTGGFRSYVGFIPEERRGLVVLANGNGDVDALALRLLDPHARPLPAHERSVGGMASTLLLAERMGAWLDLPFALWSGSLALVLVGFAVLAWRARGLAWWRAGAWPNVFRGLIVAVELGVLVVLVR